MKREQLEVYFIMGGQNVKSNDPLVVLEKALQAGVTIFQFRKREQMHEQVKLMRTLLVHVKSFAKNILFHLSSMMI